MKNARRTCSQSERMQIRTTTIHKILDAPEYLGQTVNCKTYSKSYKPVNLFPIQIISSSYYIVIASLYLFLGISYADFRYCGLDTA